MLAVSTAWNLHHGEEIRGALAKVRECGLSAIELGYRLDRDRLEGIMSFLKDFGLSVSSVHNFCPLPDDHPSPRHPSNHYRLSSLDEEERRLAVKWTHEAVKTAVRARAGVVVIHAGTVEMPDDLSEKLFKQYKSGGVDPRLFAEQRARFVTERNKAAGPYRDAVKKSLAEVLDFAGTQNVRIGLETRYYPTEIPNADEIAELLEVFHKKGLWYWHDVGHAEANDRLGIYSHLENLRKFSRYLVGFHLHGVNGLRDHQAPLEGDFDIKTVFPFIQKHHIKVIESHGSATVAQVKSAVKLLKDLENSNEALSRPSR